MKSNWLSKVWLLLLTSIIIILIASFIAYTLTNTETCSKDDYIEGKECVCIDDVLVCEVEQDEEKELKLEDFSLEGLGFNAKFITNTPSTELLGASLNTLFTSVSSEDDNLVISLEQKQLCSKDDEPPVQVGMYYIDGNELTLLSVVNTVASVYTQECVISVEFDLSKLDVEISDSLVLRYMSEQGDIVDANVCVYNDGVYNSGDVYEAEDGCNLCECVNGVSRCDNEKVCEIEEEEASPSAYWNFPNYDRFEGEESTGECSRDSQCYVRGCSNEVCSTKQEITTTCEVVTKIDNVECGCEESVCVWR